MTSRRQVRHLHLDAPDEASLRWASHLVQEALRTASLPLGRPGALVLIRALDLGTIDPRRPAQTLALQLTEAARRLVRSAVHISHPDAARRDVVWFSDHAEARALLAMRLTAGPPPSEWFWGAAFAEVLAAATLSERVARLLQPEATIAAGAPPAIVQQARILQILIHHGRVDPVLKVVPAAVAWSLPFRRAWGPPPRVPPVRLASSSVGASVTPGWSVVIRKAIEEWSADDVRTLWLAVLALVSARPELVGSPEVPRRAVAVVARLATARDRPGVNRLDARDGLRLEPAPPTGAQAASGPQRSANRALPEATSVDAADPISRVALDGAEDDAAPTSQESIGTESPVPVARGGEPSWLDPSDLQVLRGRLGLPPPLVEPMATEFGGLFFLVRALYLLGLWEVVEAEPALLDQAFGFRVLDRVLDAVGAEPDEPMRRAMVPVVEPHSLSGEDFLAPASWWTELCPEPQLFSADGPGMTLVRALVPGLWLARYKKVPDALEERIAGRTLVPGPAVDPVTAVLARRDGWAAALGRWAGLFLNSTVQDIVRKQAIVAATKTHIDVVFPIGTLDMRVRSRALDANPGWVPWLGRVVMFHYVEDDDFRLPEG